MEKGYVKLYRNEAQIPDLWNDSTLFCVYQKMKILADRNDWALTGSLRSAANRIGVSLGTMRKAINHLAKIGLIRSVKTEQGVTRIEMVFADSQPDFARLTMGTTCGAEYIQTHQDTQDAQQPVQPMFDFGTDSVSNFDTPQTRAVSNFDTRSVSNFDTPPQEIFINSNKKTTTPLLSPQPDFMAEFALFWKAYPNKKSKQRALKRWKRGNYCLAEILPALEVQKRTRNWVKCDGQFVPRADAYLNQQRYQDPLPQAEEAFVLDFKNPKTERERVLLNWLEATNPDLLNMSNAKINSVFETDRQHFENIVAMCGGNVQKAFEVMRHGWRLGCNSMRAINDRAAAYIDQLKTINKEKI